MKPIFITATGTGVGKTHAACLLINALFGLGVKAAPFKPIETGVTPPALPSDAVKLYETARSHGLNLPLEAICPVRFALPAAPDVARAGTAIDWNAIDRGFDECARSADIVLIEGAGGAFAPIEFSPIDDEFFSIDLAARFNAKILVIAGDQLGTIHNLLTTIGAIKNRINIDPFWAINIKENLDFERITQPYLSKKFGSFWCIPKDIVTIADILCK